MGRTQNLKKELKRKITIMVVPHNTIKPVCLNFSLSFLIAMLCLWTGITIWAGFLSGQHIDYLKTKTDNKLMKVKVVYFAKQVQKSREMLDQVKENDSQIRQLLEMKSKKAIVEGQGGPSAADAKALEQQLTDSLDEMSMEDIHHQTAALLNETSHQLTSFKDVLGQVDTMRTTFRNTPNIWPCEGRVTSRFGIRVHPVFGVAEFHSGFDIANTENTPLYATAYGTVKLCEWQPGYGRLIVIDHGKGLYTYFGHLQKIMVNPGERVARGQLIGLMGSTGTSTGSHVHYEIRMNNQPISPAPYLANKADHITASASILGGTR